MFKIWPTNRFLKAKSYNFHFHKNDVTWPLSAWPTHFPYIGMFSLSHRECINLQKGSSRNKMYLNSTFKSFSFVKRFWPIIRVANKSQEKFTILHVPHVGFLCYLDSDKILLWGSWLEKGGVIYSHAALQRFWKFDV